MKKCLIVVDYQNDFVSGSLGFPGAAALEPLIAEKIRQYRAEDDTVVFTLDTHEADYLQTQEGKQLPVVHCLRGSEGHALYGEVANLLQKDDLCFKKNTFGSDELYHYLQKTPFTAIELVGVVSSICVLSNAVLAKTAQPETPVIVDTKGIAGHDTALHEAAIAILRGLQIQVR